MVPSRPRRTARPRRRRARLASPDRAVVDAGHRGQVFSTNGMGTNSPLTRIDSAARSRNTRWPPSSRGRGRRWRTSRRSSRAGVRGRRRRRSRRTAPARSRSRTWIVPSSSSRQATSCTGWRRRSGSRPRGCRRSTGPRCQTWDTPPASVEPYADTASGMPNSVQEVARRRRRSTRTRWPARVGRGGGPLEDLHRRGVQDQRGHPVLAHAPARTRWRRTCRGRARRRRRSARR